MSEHVLHPRRAFLMLDTMVGLLLLSALLAALVYLGMLRQRGAARLAQQRHALEAARMTLTRLQMKLPAETDPGMTVQVVRQSVHAGAMEWVEVTAIDGRGRASISGLVPTTAPSTQPGGAP